MKRKKSLRRKFTLAALAGSVVFILVFFICTPIRNYYLINSIEILEKYSLNRISYSAEAYALKEEKKRLTCQNEATSEILTTEFRLITEDVAMLRDIYSSFLEHPERYRERVLPNSVYEDVKSAIPYVHYSQRFLKNGLTPKLDKEIKLVSNIADILPFFF